MAIKTASKKITKDEIISNYMNYVLENEYEPKSIYKFCKHFKMEEEDFYLFFGSIDGLKQAIWVKFYTNTINLLNHNKEYSNFSSRDKMLTFLFTFFELLTKNRSYVIFVLEQNYKNLEGIAQLKGLRKNIKDFATELIIKANSDKNMKIVKQSPQLLSEGAWLQLLFLLRFWMKDNSPGFEQTDLAIEKSVRTVFDVFDNSVLDGLVDFGKFLYKSNFV